MKAVATLVAIKTGDTTTVIAISPKDNVYFVPIEDAGDAMLKECADFLPRDRGEVLGIVLVSEGFKP